MKRFTLLFSILIVGALALRAFFQASPASSLVTKADNTPIRVYDATGSMLEAINANEAQVKIAPAYDATGAMLEAINPNDKVITVPAYDATGAMLDAIAVYTANQPVVAENKPVVLYGNALELQYAQPWLEAKNKSVVAYSNTLEMQYAQPWLEAENKSLIAYSNALEMQYAQPWLLETTLTISVTGSNTPLDCHRSLEMLYACKYGYGRP